MMPANQDIDPTSKKLAAIIFDHLKSEQLVNIECPSMDFEEVHIADSVNLVELADAIFALRHGGHA